VTHLHDLPPGVVHIRNYFSPAECDQLALEVEAIVVLAPLVQPRMANGTPMRMWCTNTGPLGWHADQVRGYHYTSTHPHTGDPWPAIPNMLLTAWHDLVRDAAVDPENCLINRYTKTSRLGMHRDINEKALRYPVA